MSTHRTRVAAATGAALFALALPVSAYASPLPDVCIPAVVVDNVCTVRLTSVTADAIDGTITGTPVGGGAAITLAGPLAAYQRSQGFGDVPPAPIQRWDTEIDTRSIDAHIRRLRLKLGPARNHVETVVGLGYRFVK